LVATDIIAANMVLWRFITTKVL